MTKKDYKIIAETIRSVKRIARRENKDAIYCLNLLTDILSGELLKDNPNFNETKFKTATEFDL